MFATLLNLIPTNVGDNSDRAAALVDAMESAGHVKKKK